VFSGRCGVLSNPTRHDPDWFVLAAPEDAKADAARGRGLAEQWCSQCHGVRPSQPSANSEAPSFSAIAAETNRVARIGHRLSSTILTVKMSGGILFQRSGQIPIVARPIAFSAEIPGKEKKRF
jgi:hypothetical protein